MTSGIDMTGRTCLITGATSGIGLAAALELARLGASLVLVGRNPERGERALEEVRRASRAGDVTLLLASRPKPRSAGLRRISSPAGVRCTCC